MILSQKRLSEDRTNIFLLLLILLIKAISIVLIIGYSEIDLGPDEAQYWTWSQKLDWGYYSKPPGIAWIIALGTLVLGDTEWGVRLGSLILGTCIPFAVYLLARISSLKPQTAFWAAVMMALTPFGISATFLAITDVGMILFWILGCTVIADSLKKNCTPSYLLVGICILLGALFKWPIYILWIIILGMAWQFPSLRSWKIVLGAAVSFLGLLPSVIWNTTHDWVTFRHVTASIIGQTSSNVAVTNVAVKSSGDFWGFIAAQLALISPILFIILLVAFYRLIREHQSMQRTIVFSGGGALFIFITLGIAALFTKIQGNWGDFAYPGAVVLLAWYACERTPSVKIWAKIWLQGGILLSVILTFAALSIPYIQSHNALSQFPIPYRMNPFRHNLGWQQIPEILTHAGYDPEKHFLFSEKYQTSSILSFYGPQKKRAYFLNLQGARKNQFSFWPSMSEEQKGKTGFFVIAENILPDALEREVKSYEASLTEYFAEVHFIGIYPLFKSNGISTKNAAVFKAIEYNGKEPPSVYRF